MLCGSASGAGCSARALASPGLHGLRWLAPSRLSCRSGSPGPPPRGRDPGRWTPLESLKYRLVTDVQVSPDGRRAAYVVREVDPRARQERVSDADLAVAIDAPGEARARADVRRASSQRGRAGRPTASGSPSSASAASKTATSGCCPPRRRSRAAVRARRPTWPKPSGRPTASGSRIVAPDARPPIASAAKGEGRRPRRRTRKTGRADSGSCGDARRGGPRRGAPSAGHGVLGGRRPRSHGAGRDRLFARRQDDRVLPHPAPRRQRLAERRHLARGRRHRHRPALRRDGRRRDLAALFARRPLARVRRHATSRRAGRTGEVIRLAPRRCGGPARDLPHSFDESPELAGWSADGADALLHRGQGTSRTSSTRRTSRPARSGR